MITDIFLLILTIPLTVILAVFGGISSIFLTVLPDETYQAFTTLFSYLGYFNGIFPIDTLAICITTLLTFYSFFYILKIAMWAWSNVPFLGSSNAGDFPKIGSLSNMKRDYREYRGARKYGKNPNPGKDYNPGRKV